MSQTNPESTPVPTPPASQQQSQPKTEAKPKNPLDVFKNGDTEVSGNGEVTPDMRVVSWQEGYGVIQQKKNGDWSTSLRDSE